MNTITGPLQPVDELGGDPEALGAVAARLGDALHVEQREALPAAQLLLVMADGLEDLGDDVGLSIGWVQVAASITTMTGMPERKTFFL